MAEDGGQIQTAIEFYQKIKAEPDGVTVKFRKLNGEERIMRCTLDMAVVPMNERPKDVDLGKILSLIQKHSMVHVWDLDKRGWRTVPFDRSEWIETSTNVRFSIKK